MYNRTDWVVCQLSTTLLSPLSPLGDFQNEPTLELRRASERARLTDALHALEARLPLQVPVIVAGQRRRGDAFASIDPSQPQRVVAQVAEASAAEVDEAVRAATQAQRAWGALSATERAAVLVRAAGELRSRRYELAALEVLECAKPWAEADADVAEAIDFLEFYARGAMALEQATALPQMPGERNILYHRPRGVVGVIAPWNFPLAIATGMTAAALATGNAACLKPAEQSPACALALYEALAASGLPAGVLAFLPGAGGVGAALVSHPDVQTIAFTGSGAVGLEILAKAARPAPGQRHLKRVVAEMGGKNCMIVDADADLDDVVPAALASAFGFAGQKCSATARLLVHERVAETLVARLAGALETMLVGPAWDFATDVPPVIEAEAQQRIEAVVAGASAGARSVLRATGTPSDGFYVAPTVVIEPRRDAVVVNEEVFGPVLTVETVASIDEACTLVESQRHALTGGLFSRNPRTIAEVARRTPVGNLYVNRGTTGAMVGRQPFGGNRMSGTGTKAGGSEYLLHFVEPVVVTEDTTRHGIAT
jgi:RHH-type proline utilization regulon transcriptional repressor/proline dehydrogenase/delta 1-pyrroline-5-carboxylate dehydrogenase